MCANNPFISKSLTTQHMYITHLKSGAFICSIEEPEFQFASIGGFSSPKIACGFIKEGKISYAGETMEANDILFTQDDVDLTFQQKDTTSQI